MSVTSSCQLWLVESHFTLPCLYFPEGGQGSVGPVPRAALEGILQEGRTHVAEQHSGLTTSGSPHGADQVAQVKLPQAPSEPPAADSRQHLLASISREDTQGRPAPPKSKCCPWCLCLRSCGSVGLWLAGSRSRSVLSSDHSSCLELSPSVLLQRA